MIPGFVILRVGMRVRGLHLVWICNGIICIMFDVGWTCLTWTFRFKPLGSHRMTCGMSAGPLGLRLESKNYQAAPPCGDGIGPGMYLYHLVPSVWNLFFLNVDIGWSSWVSWWVQSWLYTSIYYSLPRTSTTIFWCSAEVITLWETKVMLQDHTWLLLLQLTIFDYV